MGQLSQLQPKDSRMYFMLPQAPEDAGYYVYGTPAGGKFQFTHPAMMTMLLWVERKWSAIDDRRFGVGNISKAGGDATDEHSSHVNGLQVDVRPLRKDGLQSAVTWHDKQYDREGTGKLIRIFFAHPLVKKILFNDTSLHPRLRAWPHHDNHFHVEL
jgi:murein endopeptidase